MTTLAEIQSFLEDKTIAIIGNSESLLRERHGEAIDAFDAVIRINCGIPLGRRKALGSRTDILALALALSQYDIEKCFHPEFIMWMTPKREIMSPYLKEVAYIHDEQSWCELYDRVGSRPSTGCMMIDFIVRQTNYRAVGLFGFDFWKTKTWYIERSHIGPHVPHFEEQYISELSQQFHNISLIAS